MQWKGRRESDNVQDARGGSGKKAGRISILGIVVALIAWKFFDVNPMTAYQATTQITQQNQTQQAPSQLTAQQIEDKQFVAVILADTEDVWTPIFQQLGSTYQAPKLFLFSGAVQSGCGSASSAMGPFYCPADQKIYIDTQFFQDMRTQMGISGEKNQTQLSRQDQAGDFAQAYVIAHEVGHHVQNLLGTSRQVRQAQQKLSQAQANRLSVQLELQADCYAGLWANKNQQRTQFLQDGDIAEAMDAAEKIGDDYLQRKSRGEVVPDSFTHGTSEQRQRWFEKGFTTGDIRQCDTFNAKVL